MGRNHSPRSRLWSVSILTDLAELPEGAEEHLRKVQVRAQLLPGETDQYVFTTTAGYRGQTAHAVVGHVLRNILSTGISEIHRRARAISVSLMDLNYFGSPEAVGRGLDAGNVDVDKEL